MLLDYESNLAPSQESVVFLSALLFDTYSFAEVNMLVEKSFQCRRNPRIKHIVVGKSVGPLIDHDVTRSSIDFAVSTSLIQRIAR